MWASRIVVVTNLSRWSKRGSGVRSGALIEEARTLLQDGR